MTTPIPTGFATLDAQLGGGLDPGSLVVLGGDSGAGCSSLALGIALGAARHGRRVSVVSTENDAQRLADLALGQAAGASREELAGTALDEARRQELAAAALALREQPLTFVVADDEAPPDPAALAGEGWELLLVDSLEGLVWEAAGRDEAAAARVARLKRLAVARGGAVLLTTHLGGSLSGRSDPRPRLDDFQAAGAIRALADRVLGLFREEQYRPDRGVAGAAEVHVLKDRGGPLGTVDLWFDPACRRFEDLAGA